MQKVSLILLVSSREDHIACRPVQGHLGGRVVHQKMTGTVEDEQAGENLCKDPAWPTPSHFVHACLTELLMEIRVSTGSARLYAGHEIQSFPDRSVRSVSLGAADNKPKVLADYSKTKSTFMQIGCLSCSP